VSPMSPVCPRGVPNVPACPRGVPSVPMVSVVSPVSPMSPRVPSYVQGVVSLFYGGDTEVAEDEELQGWVGEIFTYGVLGREESGTGTRGH
ncbi:ALOX8 lipoxygenase, partial [Hirundo rustica]|nr:ALOX8 lipoxygenase [Hirundo rustica]